MTDRLREELLSVPGVADAELAAGDVTSAGVKVRLSPDADARRVASEVQRILAEHGMRSQVAAGPDPSPSVPGPPPPPGAAAVVNLADFEEEAAAAPRRGPLRVAPRTVLAGVAVEETPHGVAVVATASDGRSASRRARSTRDGLNEAVIAVIADLVAIDPPAIRVVAENELDGIKIVTVVLELVTGTIAAGSSVVEGGAPFAVGRAAWAALTLRP